MKPRTIQKTGKLLKLQLAFSFLAILAGIFCWVASFGIPQIQAAHGIILAVAGFVFFVITRLLIWWHHG